MQVASAAVQASTVRNLAVGRQEGDQAFGEGHVSGPNETGQPATHDHAVPSSSGSNPVISWMRRLKSTQKTGGGVAVHRY